MLSYISLVIYEVSMAIFMLDGFSLSKIFLTMLPWLSFLIIFHYLFANFLYIKSQSHRILFLIVLAVIFLNITSIIRSFFQSNVSLLTNFGNVYNALALLVPCAFAFGVRLSSLIFFNSIGIKLLLLGNIAFIFCLLTGVDERTTANLLISLCGSSIFLLGTLYVQKTLPKLLIIFSGLSIFSYIGFIVESRAAIIRMPLLLINLYVSRSINLIPKIFFQGFFLLALVAPLYYVVDIYAGNSIFTNLSYDLEKSSTEDGYFSLTDTRTFLYNEVYDDLTGDQQLIFGKGSGGTYFSTYFFSAEGDIANRFTVEVGFLALLLKTGIVGAGLTLAAIYLAAYLALFRSNNRFVFWLGLMLLLHSAIFFVENLVAMNVYNFLIWFFIGVCGSHKIRSLNNSQIYSLFNNKSV